MDYTKCKTFIAFRHIDPSNKSTYWIECGWKFSESTPGLFPYQTKEDKDQANELLNSYINNWGLKEVEGVIFKFDSIIGFKKDKIKESSTEKKVRKKVNVN